MGGSRRLVAGLSSTLPALVEDGEEKDHLRVENDDHEGPLASALLANRQLDLLSPRGSSCCWDAVVYLLTSIELLWVAVCQLVVLVVTTDDTPV